MWFHLSQVVLLQLGETMSIQLVAPDFVTNTSKRNQQTDATSVLLGNGNVVFAWRSNDGAEPGNPFTDDGIRARIMRANGTFVDVDTFLNSTTASSQSMPHLSAAANGGFLATWQSEDFADGSGSCIRARLFNQDGVALAPDFVVNSTGALAQVDPVAVRLGGGGHVIAWQSADTAGSDTLSGCIRIRLISDSGVLATTDIVVNSTFAGTQSEPSITAISTGGFVVTWHSGDTADGSGSAIRARVFAANGTAQGADFVVNSTAAGDQENASVSALVDGRFIVTWNSNDGLEGQFQGTSIRARVFQSDGTPDGNDFILNTTFTSNQDNPRIALLSDGRLVAVWHSLDGGDGDGDCIRGRILSDDGVAMDKDFIINTTGASFQNSPSVTTAAHGTLVVSWTSYDAADGAAPLIRSVRYNALVYTGDAAGNTWHGGSDKDQISGMDGDDTLTGGGENDNINGGNGDDVLSGNGGGDKLIGGSGIDTVSYYRDSAVTVALDKSFTARGVAVGDTFTAIENVIGSNGGDDTISGNSGNNALSGQGGHDALYGRAGNDALRGGKGNDLLAGGSGADKLYGSSGTDTASYYYDGAVDVSLDASIAATGAATGDKFSSIENLQGSLSGADTLVGNGSNNVLTGLGGNDSLIGRAGHDSFYGGRGRDRLEGGSGSDKYIYADRDEGGDIIVAFAAADSIRFKSSSFGNLEKGVIDADWFRVRTDNVAKDRDDRFIFESDTHTLWFDGNGNAPGGLTKIVTLQSNYVLTSADIIII